MNEYQTGFSEGIADCDTFGLDAATLIHEAYTIVNGRWCNMRSVGYGTALRVRTERFDFFG